MFFVELEEMLVNMVKDNWSWTRACTALGSWNKEEDGLYFRISRKNGSIDPRPVRPIPIQYSHGTIANSWFWATKCVICKSKSGHRNQRLPKRDFSKFILISKYSQKQLLVLFWFFLLSFILLVHLFQTHGMMGILTYTLRCFHSVPSHQHGHSKSEVFFLML